MNNETVQGKWTEIKGEIKNMWGKLSHDDLERTKGNLEAIGGLIHKQYGESKDDVAKKLNDVVERFKKSTADKSEEVKEALRSKPDTKLF